MEPIKLNYFKKTLRISVICLFSIFYIGCDQNECSICEGDGVNICVMCENKNNLNCIYCNDTKESICTYCNGIGIIPEK